ncbi:hypothetical protein [Bosea sp. AS-1]|uniref:hypothetical protein n=1 Tax=Bosea sp. AS-1 TaxID=2015316 RepID=UPI0020BFC02B|nr:hypothetical protein [Bosea sp. AS-1]
MTIVPWLVCGRGVDSDGAGNCVVVNASLSGVVIVDVRRDSVPQTSQPATASAPSGTATFRKRPSAVRPRATEVAAAASISSDRYSSAVGIGAQPPEVAAAPTRWGA